MSDVKNKVLDFLGTIKTVSVATSIDNKPHCRIMEIQKVDNDLKLWFVAHKSSQKMEQIDNSHEACIVAFNVNSSKDIRLYGVIDTSTDMEQKKYVWNDCLDNYFTNGINDPELMVLTFCPRKLEYRDMKTGGLTPDVENF